MASYRSRVSRKRARSTKKRSSRKYRKSDKPPVGSAPAKGPIPNPRKIPWRGPSKRRRSYVPKQPGQFHIVAESTGMQMKKLGVFQVPNYNPMAIESLGTYKYHNINQWVMFSQQGLQNVDYLENLFTRDQLFGLTDNNRYDRFKWADDPFLLNPYSVTPTNPIHSVAQPQDVARNDVLYIKSAKVTVELLNMTLLPQNTKIYFCTPHFDTDRNPIDFWTDIVESQSNQMTAAGIANDLAINTVVAGKSKITDTRSNPFTYQEFRNQWSAITSQNIILQAGEQVNFSFDIQVNKVIHRETLNEARKYRFLRGLTVFPLVITNAGMAGVAPGAEFEAAEVAYGEVKVGAIMNQMITFGALPTSRKSFNRVYKGVVENVTAGAQPEVTKVFGDDDNIKFANVRV